MVDVDNRTHVVIMAGGIGSRLFPMSTPEHPKQFIDMLDCGKTLIQLTVERFLPICPIEQFWVVTLAKYVDYVLQQLPDIPREHILLEPVARNTAPCIAYACRRIAIEASDAKVVVTPSDAYVEKTAEFAAIIDTALSFISSEKYISADTEQTVSFIGKEPIDAPAEGQSIGAASGNPESIVTVGITPTRPETGYGYIKLSSSLSGSVVKALEFKEKPDSTTAGEYLAAGNYVWNAGIFVWRVDYINRLFSEFAPGIAAVMDELEPFLATDGEQEALNRLFPKCEKISIDYAIMEKSPSVYTVAADLGWDDLGSWTSVLSQLERHGKLEMLMHWRTVLAREQQ